MDISSRKNDRVIHLRKLGIYGSYRKQHGEFYADGRKLLDEALKSGIQINEVFYSGLKPGNLPEYTQSFNVSEEIIEYVSPLQSPQEIVFSAKIPEIKGHPTLLNSIILENIQDPGNEGTVIRTANAFNIENVLLVGDCADPWNPKTIRASMGTVFREKIFFLSKNDILILKKDANVPVYAASIGKDCKDIRKFNLKKSAVVIGNESRGITDDMTEICDANIIIPMNPLCESLNASVAASVIMWEMMKDNL